MPHSDSVTLALVVVIVLYELKISASSDSLECGSQIECICPGNTVNFECTVVGAIATVWKGSFFDCPSNSVVLRHRIFTPGINGTCNNGKVVATGIEVINNRYSSQLIVTVDSGMNNGSVECIRDGSTETTVGTCPLVLAQGMICISIVLNLKNLNHMQSFIFLLMVLEYRPLARSSSLYTGVHQGGVHLSQIILLQQLTVGCVLIQLLIHS